MPELGVLSQEGKSKGKVKLDDSVFACEINEVLIREVLNQYLGNQRSGTASTKTRAEARGGGAKPWRQKGTGRARAGTIRSPIWKGGGVTFGPRPRSYYLNIPVKKRKGALRSALSALQKDGKIRILDSIKFDKPKTKDFISFLKGLKLEGKTLFIVENNNENALLSCRNLPKVRMVPYNNINIFDLLDCDNLVLTKESAKKIEEILK